MCECVDVCVFLINADELMKIYMAVGSLSLVISLLNQLIVCFICAILCCCTSRRYETMVRRRSCMYLVRVSEIGRYFSWLLLCNRACPVQPPAFFLSRVLLLVFGKLLSIKKKCHCRFVVMCVGFTTNCQNKSRSKSLPPDIHPLLFYTPRPTQQH